MTTTEEEIIVHLTRTPGYSREELSQVHSLLSRHAGPMKFVVDEPVIRYKTYFYEWDEFFEYMELHRIENLIEEEEYVACVTELPNFVYWFAAFDPEGSKNIFVHSAEWEHFIYCDPSYPIAFQIVINVMQRKLFPGAEKVNGHPLVHEATRGCINDICENKQEMVFKLRTADICMDCLQGFEQVFGSRDVLVQAVEILESLRRGMVQSRVYLKPPSFEEKLPFPVAITKRKMGMTSQPFRKFLMMIDHFDSVVRTAVIVLASLYFPKPTELKKFLEENALSERPSLGSWVQSLAKLSKIKSHTTTISLPDDFDKKIKHVVRLENQNKLVSIRNEMRGHGYISCEDDGYDADFTSLLPVLEEMEHALSPLFEGFKYLHVRDARHLGRGEYLVSHISLSGSNAAFVETESRVSFDYAKDVPEHGKCYLVSQDTKEWTPLDPYLKYGKCPECNHPRVLIYDGNVFLDPFIGHRVDLGNMK